MIEIKNLYLKYIREYYALYNINLTIENGESVAFVGDEGSGKTTLMRVLAKLENFDSGEIYLNDINIKKIDFVNDINLGYIPQKSIFLENKTVYENLKYVLKQRNYQESEIEEKVNNALIDFNLERYRNQKTSDLNLFERHIISLVRLSLRPLDIVLIDNIIQDMSDADRLEVLDLIKKLFVDKNMTTIIATDDENKLGGLCKRVVNFKNGTIK